MLVLHATWLPAAHHPSLDGFLAFWGEAAPDTPPAARRGRRAKVSQHPFAADAAALEQSLRRNPRRDVAARGAADAVGPTGAARRPGRGRGQCRRLAGRPGGGAARIDRADRRAAAAGRFQRPVAALPTARFLLAGILATLGLRRMSGRRYGFGEDGADHRLSARGAARSCDCCSSRQSGPGHLSHLGRRQLAAGDRPLCAFLAGHGAPRRRAPARGGLRRGRAEARRSDPPLPARRWRTG